MESTVIDSIISQGGVAGVAMLALWMLNRVWSEYTQQIRQDRDRLADLMERNVEAVTEMKTLLTAVAARLEP